MRLDIPTLRVAAGSDTGHRYPANFDVLHVGAAPPMIVVADGMGAGEGSALAGRTAVNVFVEQVTRAEDPASPDLLRAAVAEAQHQVGDAGRRLGTLTGCTLTALLPGTEQDPYNGWIVQIGDSRAYRLRDGLLELLTVDHTVAWLGAVYGWYPAGSSTAASARYWLTRYIGHASAPEPDILSVRLRPGDVFCICTDGIAEQVPYDRLAKALGSSLPPAQIVDGLLADARAAGGRDNATLAVVQVTEASAPGSPPTMDQERTAQPLSG